MACQMSCLGVHFSIAPEETTDMPAAIDEELHHDLHHGDDHIVSVSLAISKPRRSTRARMLRENPLPEHPPLCVPYQEALMAIRRFDPGEIQGHRCPACGRAAGIRRERRTEAYDTGHLALAAIFGWLGVLAAVGGRTRVRLRCTNCQCQFPEPIGFVRGLLAWLIVAGAIVGMTYLATLDARLAWLIAGVLLVFTIVGCLVSRLRRQQRIALWHQQYALETGAYDGSRQPAGHG
jgi:hypothetical protein